MFVANEPIAIDGPIWSHRVVPDEMKRGEQSPAPENGRIKVESKNLLARQYSHRAKITSFVPILLCNRYIYAEASRILYGENTFTFLDHDLCQWALRNMGEKTMGDDQKDGYSACTWA